MRNVRLEQYAFLLAEELRLLRIKKYGSGAERLSDGQLALLELEPGVCAAEVASEGEVAPADKPKNGKGRSDAGGITAICRWLSEATPPVVRPQNKASRRDARLRQA